MKVFSIEKFREMKIKDGFTEEDADFSISLWGEKCEGKTVQECSPYNIDESWLIEVQEMESNKLKAYTVRIDDDNGYDTVVFAENASRAKALAINDVLCVEEYVNLRPTRYKEADCLAKKEGLLNMKDKENRKFLEELGWWFEERLIQNETDNNAK